MPALSYNTMYDNSPSFLPQPQSSSGKMQYAVSHSALPPHPPSSHTPPPGSVTSSASSPFHQSVRRIVHSPSTQQQQQQQDSIVYAHSSPLPHAQMQQHPHSSGGGNNGSGQSVYVVQPSHSYSPPGASFQRGLPAPVSTVSQPYHIAAQQQPHSPTHAGAFRPFKSAPISPPSSIRPGVVYSFPQSNIVPSGSPSSPVPVAASSQPTILIHSSSYSPSAPYPRLLSSPVPHSPGDAVLRPLAVRRTGSPPLPSSALLNVPLTSQSSCPTCSHHSHPSQHPHSQMHTRTLSNGFIVSSAPQYHTVQSHPQHAQSHPHSQSSQSHSHNPHHPPLHSSHRLSPACVAAGCAYPVSPRSEHRMLTSDDDDAYNHHSHHSHLSMPSSSSSSSPSLGQPRYSSGGSSYFIPSSVSGPPMQQQQQQHPQPHYVVAAAGPYEYSPPVAHSHLQPLPSHPPGRVGVPSHVQYGAPPPGTAYTVQSIPIATLSPSSASPSSASSTSSAVSASGPFPSAASSTSVGSSSSLSAPSSPRAAKSKRSAAHMREFVRNYFLRHSASLVNKDLTSISAELQAAYEKETSNGDSAVADSVGDRKPVFCRTFIQKVARSLGFILTLHFGLVDKRMKHLMKIRKRGKKNSSKKHITAAGTDTAKLETADGDAHTVIKHEQQQQQQSQQHNGSRAVSRIAAVDDEDEVAAAAHHMEEMAAALDTRGGEGASGGSSAATAAARVLVKEEADEQLADRSQDQEDDADDDDEEDGADSEEDAQQDLDDNTPQRGTAVSDGSVAVRSGISTSIASDVDEKKDEAAVVTKMDL